MAPIIAATDRNERAASLVEYTMLMVFVAIASLGAITVFGDSNTASLDGSGQELETAWDD